jgi:3',5'-cyclic AMP phosphodiesterase CpdA
MYSVCMDSAANAALRGADCMQRILGPRGDTLSEYDAVARWTHRNGAIGHDQLAWLISELQDAKRAEQRVLVFAHCPLHPAVVSSRKSSLLWNFEEVLDILHQSGNVVATFTGVLDG